VTTGVTMRAPAVRIRLRPWFRLPGGCRGSLPGEASPGGSPREVGKPLRGPHPICSVGVLLTYRASTATALRRLKGAALDVFELRQRLIDDYARYVRSLSRSVTNGCGSSSMTASIMGCYGPNHVLG
jgi:hypothetical protein